MPSLRTFLLERTQIAVLDQELVANAATRPSRDTDVDRFEETLLQLGFVASLDLAMTIRRLPHEALEEVTAWILDTLGKRTGISPKPVRSAPDAYAKRALAHLAANATQPCPWCARIATVHALDPCGHLVCATCWSGGNYAGCPICHRRTNAQTPFLPCETVAQAGATPLRLIQLAFDLAAVARYRFEGLLARRAPLDPEEREELITLIDAMGPKVAKWLPATIAVRETMAIAVGRLWMISPDRAAMLAATKAHVATATDVLRVAMVLVGGDPALGGKARLRSIGRGLRRTVLAALDRLPSDALVDDMRRHRAAWLRIGEQVHPGEYVKEYPNTAAAFALVRRGQLPSPLAAVETALANRDVLGALAQLATRPGELLRRADHVLRIATPAELPATLDAIAAAIPKGEPRTLFGLLAHIAKRDQPWPQRVIFSHGALLEPWHMPDTRPPQVPAAIASTIEALRTELMARAAAGRLYARAVIDRALVDLPIPGDCAAKWPRGSELVIPPGTTLRLFAGAPCSVALYDAAWQFRSEVAAPGDHVIELAIDALAGIRHAVLLVHAPTTTVGLGTELRSLARAAPAAVPFAIDLEARRACWFELGLRAVPDRGWLGAFARDFTAFVATHARPTLWDVACVHATARANVVYVREAGNEITQYRRRDGESIVGRLGRLSTSEHDGVFTAIPIAEAPTWVALMRDDFAIPNGSAGFVVAASDHPRTWRVIDALDLVTELLPKRA